MPSSTSSPPPEPPVFFIDRSLSKNTFARLFAAADVRCEVHDDHFKPDEDDETWIKEAARRGWIILTVDRRIRYNPREKRALIESGGFAFMLATRHPLRADEMAAIYLRAIETIVAATRSHQPPMIFKVYQDGRVEPWLSDAD